MMATCYSKVTSNAVTWALFCFMLLGIALPVFALGNQLFIERNKLNEEQANIKLKFVDTLDGKGLTTHEEAQRDRMNIQTKLAESIVENARLEKETVALRPSERDLKLRVIKISLDAMKRMNLGLENSLPQVGMEIHQDKEPNEKIDSAKNYPEEAALVGNWESA